MKLSKRERMLKFLELDDQPDKCPVFTFGFEVAGYGMKQYLESEWHKNNVVGPENINWGPEKFRRRTAYVTTIAKFFKADTWLIDPFKKYKRNILSFDEPIIKEIKEEFPEAYEKYGLKEDSEYNWNCLSGRIMEKGYNNITGVAHEWFVSGIFQDKKILEKVWDHYGKPIDRVWDEPFSQQVWEEYTEGMSPYFYPMANISIPLSEYIMESHGHGYCAKLMRKDPEYIHYLADEYAKANCETIKRLGEAGVDIVMFLDDLGQKNRTLYSPKHFREFILPAYKKIYQTARKHGVFVVQHSCGYLESILESMVDAGLHAIQGLQPTANNSLEWAVETLGDKMAIMSVLDDSRILEYGTPKDVEEDVKRAIRIAGPTGNFSVGPTNTLLDPPFENVLAMIDAMEKYSYYPLKV